MITRQHVRARTLRKPAGSRAAIKQVDSLLIVWPSRAGEAVRLEAFSSSGGAYADVPSGRTTNVELVLR